MSAETRKEFEVAAADENEFLQNQLTHLVPHQAGVRCAGCSFAPCFSALEFLAKNRYNQGKLGGIPSIHFARWVLLPNRGVLFFSNFDSSWPSYLGDFIDQASSGLTAVWSNTVDYPRSTWLVSAGSRDAARFLGLDSRAPAPDTSVVRGLPRALDRQRQREHGNPARAGRSGLPRRRDLALSLLRGVDRGAADELFGEARRVLPLPVDEIQGIILWGYGHMPRRRYLLLPREARERRPALLACRAAAHLGRRLAHGSPPEPLVNVAFSHRGLQALGVEPELCDRFSTRSCKAPIIRTARA